MSTYSAEEIAEILTKEGHPINKRTVQYYSQLDIGQPEMVGKRRRYTDKSLNQLRAFFTLKQPGVTLEQTRHQLNGMDENLLRNAATISSYRNVESISNIHSFTSEVTIHFGNTIDETTKQNIIQKVDEILTNKGE